MAILSFDKDVVVDYVPAYSGNRDSEDPCIVRLKFVPYSRVQQYSRLIAAKTKGVDDPSKIAVVSQSVQKRQFVENVDSISGYYVGGAEVTDAAEFYETADTELVLEVVRAMENTQKLSEGQIKN
ncbi:MAG: hypothetical protein BMS9Abin23_1108 [Thermodesulfobacteriota bacterium]|nr:MAG: hypothetical protein BMS9Abin23_1108 [Thermodesulfobacteriota bacterium]